MGFLRRLLGGSASSEPGQAGDSTTGQAPGSIAAASVAPASLDPSWPIVPERRQVAHDDSRDERAAVRGNRLPVLRRRGGEAAEGRKKCTSCGVYMFVIVIDRSRRRLVTEAEMEERPGDRDGAGAKRRTRQRIWNGGRGARAAGIQVGRDEYESVFTRRRGRRQLPAQSGQFGGSAEVRPDDGRSMPLRASSANQTTPYDRNAVQVLIHGRLVGYLSRDDAEGRSRG